MYRYIVVVLLISCFEVQQSSARSNNGICTKMKSKTAIINKLYLTTCLKTYKTCLGWAVLNISCKYKLREFNCTKSRYEQMVLYDVERTCCPGYKREVDNIQNLLVCEKGCLDGYYGEFCSVPCNCHSNAYVICDQDNGTCSCTAGWTGVNCTEGCPDGHFGDGCENVCPCQNNATCNSSDGSCMCTEPGWTGIYCDKVCPMGFYGNNCSKKCDCYENQTCLPKTGECVCKAGLTGQNCTQVYLCNRDGTENCDKRLETGTCTRKFDEQECHTNKASHDRYMDVKGNIIDTCACRRNKDQLCVPIGRSCKCKHGYISEWCREETAGGKTYRAVTTDGGNVAIGVSVGASATAVVIVILVVVLLRKKLVVKKTTASNNQMFGLAERKDDGADSTKAIQSRDNKIDSNKVLQDKDNVYTALYHERESDYVNADSKDLYEQLHEHM